MKTIGDWSMILTRLWMNWQYTGRIVEGRFEGEGEYTFPDGVVYRGGFRDGQFHGEGELRFPSGGIYRAVFDNGTEVEGTFVFADGLTYDPTPDWTYLQAADRRFFTELTKGGVRPAGTSNS